MVLQGEHAIDREHIRFMTMFDYQPKCRWCAWDAPLDDGVHTGNDAIRDEAEALRNRVDRREPDHGPRPGARPGAGLGNVSSDRMGSIPMSMGTL